MVKLRCINCKQTFEIDEEQLDEFETVDFKYVCYDCYDRYYNICKECGKLFKYEKSPYRTVCDKCYSKLRQKKGYQPTSKLDFEVWIKYKCKDSSYFVGKRMYIYELENPITEQIVNISKKLSEDGYGPYFVYSIYNPITISNVCELRAHHDNLFALLKEHPPQFLDSIYVGPEGILNSQLYKYIDPFNALDYEKKFKRVLDIFEVISRLYKTNENVHKFVWDLHRYYSDRMYGILKTYGFDPSNVISSLPDRLLNEDTDKLLVLMLKWQGIESV